MAWYYGYRFKWKYVKRLAEEQGFYNGDVGDVDCWVEKYLRDLTNVYFRVRPDHGHNLILVFHASNTKGDTTGLRTSMTMMKVMGMLLRGDEDDEREPKWYTTNIFLARHADDDSSDDEHLPMKLPENFFDSDPYVARLNGFRMEGVSQPSSEGTEKVRRLKTKKRRMKANEGKLKIMSAGKARKSGSHRA